jgi:hypothetical protein
MKIKVDVDDAKVKAAMATSLKQVKFAVASALTKTAVEVRKAIPGELDKAFDRPTPFTKNGTYTKRATRDELVAEVGFKEIQSNYLAMQESGGIYDPHEAGIRLPGNIQLNAFGNIPRGIIAKLKEAAENGQLSAALARRIGVGGTNRRKGQKGQSLQLFFGVPRGAGWENAPLGIWRRIPGSSGGPGKLVPVILFEDTPAKYEKKLDMEAIAGPVIESKFKQILDQEIDKALATAK